MKRQRSRLWAVLACGVALSCGKSKPFVGGPGQGGPAGSTEPPPLRACILNRESTARADFCELSLQCPASTSVTTTCRLSGDTWSCECQGTTGPELHEVSGLGSPEVCEAVAAVCASRKTPSGPEECTWTAETREPVSCRLERACVRGLENADEVAATITSHDGATCSDDGSGGLACTCGHDGRSILVAGQNGLQACETAIEICAVNLIPVYSESLCRLEAVEETNASCRAYPTCYRPGVLNDGVAVIEDEHGEIACSNTLDGSRCTCFTKLGQSAQFTLALPTAGHFTCEQYAPLCGEVAPIARSEIECVPGEQSVSGESCFASVTCTEAAELNGVELEVFGTLSADCVRVGDRFVCNCIAYDDNAQIDVEAGTSSDACAAAMTECQHAVTVTIGDGVILPPVPPP